jgi:hypothetical protein
MILWDSKMIQLETVTELAWFLSRFMGCPRESAYKKQVKWSLCLYYYDAMKTYGGVEVQFPALLTTELHGDEWSASRPDRFTPAVGVPALSTG